MQKILLVFIFFVLCAPQVLAVSPIIQRVSISDAMVTPIATYVQYNLPFPGILPGHRMYKFKVLRDKIIEALLIDPKQKIGFYLKQTDKGILATAMLVDQGKFVLVKDTALKAENNYTLLTHELYELNGNPGPEFFNTLALASAKHQEVLASLLPRVPVDVRPTLETVIGFSLRNLISVQEFEKQVNNE